jgi:hypothetical protein
MNSMNLQQLGHGDLMSALQYGLSLIPLGLDRCHIALRRAFDASRYWSSR